MVGSGRIASSVIGNTVAGTIDRPVGSRHPQHTDIVYPVNYGFVDGVVAGDGEDQDAYVLGTDEPNESFEGKVIAVWHRLDDVEDKWVVSLDGSDYPDEEILRAIHFQEQYFRGELLRQAQPVRLGDLTGAKTVPVTSF